MALLTVSNLCFGFGGEDLIDDVSFTIQRGERICLMGRNGSGKSTLLRLINGDIEPDSGQIGLLAGTVVAQLPQEVPSGIEGTVLEVVEGGVDRSLENRRRAEQARRTVSRLDLPGDSPFAPLSAGMRRRVLLARALAADPALLLLDEPTNHMDIRAILNLEEILLRLDAAVVFVTHDREFLARLATRIMEINRGRIFDWDCGYAKFLQRKEAVIQAEAADNARADKKLAQEEAWVRQGVLARRKRNMGRVRQLGAMRMERLQRRDETGVARMEISKAERTGMKVFEAQGASFGYGGSPVVRDVTTLITRADRIGVVGPNGCGKTTLLRGILGELEPLSGSVKLGSNLQVVYFDQLREQLELERTVADNVADGNEVITINGRSTHVLGYLTGFLFTAERARALVKSLSGGERNRLLLARLFAMPSNVLVMDEPTNDLDIETLEVLENCIFDYPGTILLVSHDRAFLDNVVTATFVWQGNGIFREFAGGYREWSEPIHAAAKPAQAKPAPAGSKKTGLKRLTWNEKEELRLLPGKIEELEAQQAKLHRAMTDPAYFKRSGGEIAADSAKAAQIEAQIAAAYSRWQKMESREE